MENVTYEFILTSPAVCSISVQLIWTVLEIGSVVVKTALLDIASRICSMYIVVLYSYWRKEGFFNKIFTSHFIARVRKGLLKVCVWEGSGDRTETAIFWPPLLWPSTLCLSCSPDARPEAQRPSSQLNNGFLYCILSATSLVPKLHRGSRGPLRPGVVLPTTSRLSPPPTLLKLDVLTFVLTELYNSSTPTRSPSRSLKSHVWSSSSGNNCHAVHWSLRCVSLWVYHGNFLARPISSANFRPRDFLS